MRKNDEPSARAKIPPKTTEIDLAEVERYASMGLTPAQIATRLRLDDSVLEQEAFCDAVEYWRMVGMSRVARTLYDLAEEGNLRAITFLLKAVGGWSETSRSGRRERESRGSKSPRWDEFLLDVVPEGTAGSDERADGIDA